MKRTIIAMCSSALLLSSGAVFAQASGASGAGGSMGMKDAGMASDTMASGAMGMKQHPKKHAKKPGMNAEQAASAGKGQ
ncbi:pentapeptide MXKDX repeat protein [Paraburkholderia aromaticivorans]|uniref:pentapeptide MXKDX repeat protein n=1 Tax=Paraburkholderia aromaticivorans TaxID=2026199 RepID=UPI0038B88A96